MRHLFALVLALAGVLGCGSLGFKSPPSPTTDVRHTQRGTPASEVVLLDVALVERPRGNEFLDRLVWRDADEQGVDLEIKPLLEQNGLRIAQFGLLPEGLQALLASPRSCPAPRRLRGEPDQPIVVQVGPERRACQFRLSAGEEGELSLKRAQCEFTVVASALEDGYTKLRFTPRVKHGQARMSPRVARDPDGQLRWAVEAAEPIEEYANLRFDLIVGAGEFVVLGTRQDQPGTLGHAFFVPGDEQPVQYLLVLRATRITPTSTEPSPNSTPLVTQTSKVSVRGLSR